MWLFQYDFKCSVYLIKFLFFIFHVYVGPLTWINFNPGMAK